MGGVGGVIGGGSLFVEGGRGIGGRVGVRECVMGVRVVGGGRWVGEVGRWIVGGLKKNGEIGIGKVVGRNVLKVLFVVGWSGWMSGLEVRGMSNVELWVVGGWGMVVWLLGVLFGKGRMRGIEGRMMVVW